MPASLRLQAREELGVRSARKRACEETEHEELGARGDRTNNLQSEIVHRFDGLEPNIKGDPLPDRPGCDFSFEYDSAESAPAERVRAVFLSPHSS